MLRASIVIIALTLAGCGASQADIDNKVAREVDRRLAEAKKEAAREAEPKKPSAAEAARDRSVLRADIRDARTVVLERMGEINREADADSDREYRFQIDITNLDGVSWDWSERELVAKVDLHGAETGRADEIDYAVDPRALSGVRLATYQGMPAVRFDCAKGKCITARGKRKTATEDDMRTSTVAERRAYNVWAVPDKSDARRVVDALDRIVAASKAL